MDLSRVNAQIDVGVVPSIWDETLCFTGLEFLLCGVPVIASSLGGMLDYVEDGVNGLLVQPGDADDLAKAMASFLDTPSLSAELRPNAAALFHAAGH